MLAPLQPNEPEEPNPFAACNTLAEIIAFLNHIAGEDAVRELLAMTDDGGLTCEFLEHAADELQEAELSKIAAIVAGIASGLPSQFDIGCPYADGSTNAQIWHQNWLRSQRWKANELEESLRRQKPRQATKTSIASPQLNQSSRSTAAKT